MSTPDSSGALSVVSAVMVSAGAALQYVWRQQAEREAREKAKREEREERDKAAIEARVKTLEDKDHQRELALTRLEGDVAHMRSTLDEVRLLIRAMAGLPESPVIPLVTSVPEPAMNDDTPEPNLSVSADAPSPPVSTEPTNTAQYLMLLRSVCQELHHDDYRSEQVVQGVGAVAEFETGFGRCKPFSRPATSSEPAWHSYNYGAQQCSKVAVNGVCPEHCFPARDTSPTSSGTSIAYTACFQVHDDDHAGAFSLMTLLTVSRPGIAEALPTGDVQQVAEAMYENHYFEGFGATKEERVNNYADALFARAQTNATKAHVELAVERGETLSPGALAGGFTVLAMISAIAYRLTRSRP